MYQNKSGDNVLSPPELKGVSVSAVLQEVCPTGEKLDLRAASPCSSPQGETEPSFDTLPDSELDEPPGARDSLLQLCLQTPLMNKQWSMAESVSTNG